MSNLFNALQTNQNRDLGHFKIKEKKRFSHPSGDFNVDSSSSTRSQPLYKITEILAPTKKLQNNINSADKKSNQKTLTWRSPLVFSPQTKFSPQLSKCANNYPENNKNQFHNVMNESVDSIFSKNTQELTLAVQKSPKTVIFSQNPLNRGSRCQQFLLSDKDNCKEMVENREFRNEINAKYSDLCSTLLLDELGTGKSKHQSEDRSNKVSNAMEYFSQLVSPKSKKSEKQNGSVDKENVSQSHESQIISPSQMKYNMTQANMSMNSQQLPHYAERYENNMTAEVNLRHRKPLSHQNQINTNYPLYYDSQDSFREMSQDREYCYQNRPNEQHYEGPSLNESYHAPWQMHVHDYYKPNYPIQSGYSNPVLTEVHCGSNYNSYTSRPSVIYGSNIHNTTANLNQTVHDISMTGIDYGYYNVPDRPPLDRVYFQQNANMPYYTNENRLNHESGSINKIRADSITESNSEFHTNQRTPRKNYTENEGNISFIDTDQETEQLTSRSQYSQRIGLNTFNTENYGYRNPPETVVSVQSNRNIYNSQQNQFPCNNTVNQNTMQRCNCPRCVHHAYGLIHYPASNTDPFVNNHSPYFQHSTAPRQNYLSHNTYMPFPSENTHTIDMAPPIYSYGQPRCAQPNDKEYVMQKFLGSLNQNR